MPLNTVFLLYSLLEFLLTISLNSSVHSLQAPIIEYCIIDHQHVAMVIYYCPFSWFCRLIGLAWSLMLLRLEVSRSCDHLTLAWFGYPSQFRLSQSIRQLTSAKVGAQEGQSMGTATHGLSTSHCSLHYLVIFLCGQASHSILLGSVKECLKGPSQKLLRTFEI